MSDHGLDLAVAAPQEFMALRVSDQEFCVEIGTVREVRRKTPVARLPHAPRHVRGVINLRGVILPVIGMRERLGLEPSDAAGDEIVAIIEVGGKLLGLLVDEVSDIITAPDDALPQGSALDDETLRALVKSVLTIGDRAIGVLAPEQLLPETHGLPR